MIAMTKPKAIRLAFGVLMLALGAYCVQCVFASNDAPQGVYGLAPPESAYAWQTSPAMKRTDVLREFAVSLPGDSSGTITTFPLPGALRTYYAGRTLQAMAGYQERRFEYADRLVRFRQVEYGWHYLGVVRDEMRGDVLSALVYVHDGYGGPRLAVPESAPRPTIGTHGMGLLTVRAAGRDYAGVSGEGLFPSTDALPTASEPREVVPVLEDSFGLTGSPEPQERDASVVLDWPGPLRGSLAFSLGRLNRSAYRIATGHNAITLTGPRHDDVFVALEDRDGNYWSVRPFGGSAQWVPTARCTPPRELDHRILTPTERRGGLVAWIRATGDLPEDVVGTPSGPVLLPSVEYALFRYQEDEDSSVATFVADYSSSGEISNISLEHLKVQTIRPYEYVLVEDLQGRMVAEVFTSEFAEASVEVPPGRYLLHGLTSAGQPGRPVGGVAGEPRPVYVTNETIQEPSGSRYGRVLGFLHDDEGRPVEAGRILAQYYPSPGRFEHVIADISAHGFFTLEGIPRNVAVDLILWPAYQRGDRTQYLFGHASYRIVLDEPAALTDLLVSKERIFIAANNRGARELEITPVDENDDGIRPLRFRLPDTCDRVVVFNVPCVPTRVRLTFDDGKEALSQILFGHSHRE